MALDRVGGRWADVVDLAHFSVGSSDCFNRRKFSCEPLSASFSDMVDRRQLRDDDLAIVIESEL